MIYAKRCCVAAVIGFAMTATCAAQEVKITRHSTLSDGRLLFGVDPENPSMLFELLSDPQITLELGLSHTESAAVAQVATEYSVERRRLGHLGVEPSQLAEIKALHQELDVQNVAALEEILTPQRLDRLKQLAYRMDISKIGLTNSLLDGRLASVAGVYDNQRERIGRRGAEIEAQLEARIAELRIEAEQKILDELLSSEQSKRVKAAVGPMFNYQEFFEIRDALNRFKGTMKD